MGLSCRYCIRIPLIGVYGLEERVSYSIVLETVQ